MAAENPRTTQEGFKSISLQNVGVWVLVPGTWRAEESTNPDDHSAIVLQIPADPGGGRASLTVRRMANFGSKIDTAIEQFPSSVMTYTDWEIHTMHPEFHMIKDGDFVTLRCVGLRSGRAPGDAKIAYREFTVNKRTRTAYELTFAAPTHIWTNDMHTLAIYVVEGRVLDPEL